MRLSRPGAAVCLAALAVAAAAGAQRAPAPTLVYAYLDDNTVVRTDPQLAGWVRVRLGPPSRELASTGTLLAVSRDRRFVWALDREGNRLVRLTRDLAIRQVVALPQGWSPRALAVGPRSGDVYVAYNRVYPTTNPSRHDPYRSAALAAFDSRGRGPLRDLTLHRHGLRSWLVWTLALDAGESRAYVAYHGSDTSGLDIVSLAGAWRRCDGGSTHGGCWGQPHGAVDASGDSIVTSTGLPWVAEFSPDGTIDARLETGLEGNHLMSFALDRAADRLYAVGSCGYVPGFAALTFSTGERLVLAHARNVCGEQLVVADDSVIVGSAPVPVASPGVKGALLRVDPATGSLLRRRTTPAEPVSLLAIRSGP